MGQVPNNEARTPSELADLLMANDPRIRRLGKRIAKQQDRLKAAITAKQFRIYLRIEEMVNERMVAIIERVWAAADLHGRHESTDKPSHAPAARSVRGVTSRAAQPTVDPVEPPPSVSRPV